MNDAFELTVDFIKLVLAKHDVGCIFELDAPDRIRDRLVAAGFHTTRDVFGPYCDLPKFHQCFVLSEIYCPHEGIDRRAEYGMIG
jgi:hypothetical protein